MKCYSKSSGDEYPMDYCTEVLSREVGLDRWTDGQVDRI